MSVEISTTAGVTNRERDRAIEKIDKVVRNLEAPALRVDIRLSVDNGRGRERPAHARALLDVNGSPVRVQVAASTIDEAIDLLDARLRRRLKSLAEHRQALRRAATPGSSDGWHRDDADARPGYYDRPRSERAIVRQKSFAIPDGSVDEAIFDLESMDYDFYLFTHGRTGLDAVVWRNEDTSYGLQFATDEGGPVEVNTVAEVEIDERGVPQLTDEEAVESLDASGLPWLFYRSARTGRARILYRRYDGHYGQLIPASE